MKKFLFTFLFIFVFSSSVFAKYNCEEYCSNDNYLSYPLKKECSLKCEQLNVLEKITILLEKSLVKKQEEEDE